ncbi:MAG TPA: hypothetical protein DEH78_12635 [Solibacterales bacterium]|nr:hypothetical protein [Bryobacterales bacterium]
MRNSGPILLLLAGALGAQTPAALEPGSSFHINLPDDSPVTLVKADMGQSRAEARGGALVLDLHAQLTLRNSGARRIRGVSLLVMAQEVTPGGKGSVTVPSLHIGPGETFPVRVDLRLLRPAAVIGGPLVQVALDGVLFDDLGFYGPNRLNSRRAMMQWELEARRDRKYFQAALDGAGIEGLRKELLAGLSRQAGRPRVDVQVSRAGRATNVEPERELKFAFLHLPGAPVEALAGAALSAGNELRAPSIEVRNRSDREVRYLEVGWLVRDRQGREFLAGSVPADLALRPGQSSTVSQQTSLKLTERPGVPVPVDGIAGYVATVEFSDGTLWIPNRDHLAQPRLQKSLAPSPEEQRLTELYRKRGLTAVVDELQRLR